MHILRRVFPDSQYAFCDSVPRFSNNEHLWGETTFRSSMQVLHWKWPFLLLICHIMSCKDVLLWTDAHFLNHTEGRRPSPIVWGFWCFRFGHVVSVLLHTVGLSRCIWAHLRTTVGTGNKDGKGGAIINCKHANFIHMAPFEWEVTCMVYLHSVAVNSV